MNKSKYKWVRSASSPPNQSVQSSRQHTNPLMKISQFKSVSSSYQPCPPKSRFHVENKKKVNNQSSSNLSISDSHKATLTKDQQTKSFVSNYKLVKSTADCATKVSVVASFKEEFIKNKKNFKLDLRLKKSPKQSRRSSGSQSFFRKPPAMRSRYKIDLREKRSVKGPKHRILYTKHKKRILSLDLKKFSSLHKRIEPPISKQILNYQYRSSIQKAKHNLVIKKKLPCIFFNRTGLCKSGNTCKFRHDPTLIRLCSKFLKGCCALGEKCPLSHTLDDNKLPICSFFIRGQCVKPNCLYLHVKHSPDAPECILFQKGLCKKGKLCSKRHVWKKQISNAKKQSVNVKTNLLEEEAISTTEHNTVTDNEIKISSESTCDQSWRFCKGPGFIPLPDPDELDVIDI